MSKWTISKPPELIAVPMNGERYEQMLAGITSIMYEYFAKSFRQSQRSIESEPNKKGSVSHA